MREVWVISACTDLINATASRYSEGLVAPDIEKEFYRLQGDLYSQCRTKVLVFFFTSDEVTERMRFIHNSRVSIEVTRKPLTTKL